MRWPEDHGLWRQFALCLCPGSLNSRLFTLCEPQVVPSGNRMVNMHRTCRIQIVGLAHCSAE